MAVLAVPMLLGATHIGPWADFESDAERLDAFKGILLSPHVDAAFDLGFIRVQDDGAIVVNIALEADARAVHGLNQPLRLRGMNQGRLPWHLGRVVNAHLAVHS